MYVSIDALKELRDMTVLLNTRCEIGKALPYTTYTGRQAYKGYHQR